jgi:hypothetical protein
MIRLCTQKAIGFSIQFIFNSVLLKLMLQLIVVLRRWPKCSFALQLLYDTEVK